MSNYMYYCHICGKLLDKPEVKQLYYKTWNTKKYVKLYDTCSTCMNNITNRRFKMPVIKKHTNPQFHTIYMRERVDGRQKTTALYEALDEHLDKLRSLEVAKDDLVLKTKFNKRFWTKGAMLKALEQDDKFLLEQCYKLYEYQTKQEQAERRTISGNAIGFNQPDAGFLTGMAQLYKSKGLKAFTANQIRGTRKRMYKYAAQLTLMANIG